MTSDYIAGEIQKRRYMISQLDQDVRNIALNHGCDSKPYTDKLALLNHLNKSLEDFNRYLKIVESNVLLTLDADKNELQGVVEIVKTKNTRSLLQMASYLVPSACREDFDFAEADLRRDRKKMLKAGFGVRYIRFVVGWRTCWTIAGFIYPRVKGWLLKALALEVIMKKLGMW